jgi:hypothetical protein
VATVAYSASLSVNAERLSDGGPFVFVTAAHALAHGNKNIRCVINDTTEP